jgi:CheY-like chemotaxis protein
MRTAEHARRTRLIVVIDDDPAVLEGMSGLLESWGYTVVVAPSEDAALARLAEHDRSPDGIVCDYHLSKGKTGPQAIARLRSAFEIPAVVITGDATAAATLKADTGGWRLLHKPVDPVALRDMLSQMFRRNS